MENVSLKEQAEEVLKKALEHTAQRSVLKDLHQEIQVSYERLKLPMRVAVVGRVNAGKSTVVNALMEKELAPVDSTEATYNISWIKYGDVESYTIHFKDTDTTECRSSLKDLKDFVLRSDKEDTKRLQNRIKYVEISYPSPVLKTFNIIDTPGLNSVFGYDSQNTKDFLKESKPDAILFLFHKNPGEKDAKEIVDYFQDGALAQANPINAVGVLTKTDNYWPQADPIEQGREVVKRLPGEIDQLMYNIYPLCGAAAFGATTMTQQDLDGLIALSGLSPAILQFLLSDASIFSTKEELKSGKIPVSTTMREALYRKFGLFGIGLACNLIKEHSISNCEMLSVAILQKTGFLELKQAIVLHFGNRAYLIKLHNGIQRIKKNSFEKKQSLTADEQQIASDVYNMVSRLEDEEHSFREFKILRDYYAGELRLSPEEIKDVTEVTGENGISCAERLGLPTKSTIEEMLASADEKLARWRRKENSFLVYNYRTKQAARVISESYNRIRYHVEEARKHLYFISE